MCRLGCHLIRHGIFVSCAVTLFAIAARDTLALGLELRPHAGGGYASALGDGPGGGVFHAGGRVLLAANATKLYGLEATYLRVPGKGGTRAEYLATGIVLEQRLWGCFNMSIGTVGYVGLSSGLGNLFGIVTNLGWEPDWGRISPFFTYRSDWIFSQPKVNINSVSAGTTVRF
jgi:hypothetical protein